ncbi:MAG: endonuclease/exonuclease/phosphatase family protein [Spirochaetaceae bacterium]|jgi:endonuclease/exonuclease/phosphatase family metal-dependent hydrolase|nr:endonuclease/exonuclease/phosphatase family protein [Spirochaetaceae bacterium]
MKHVFVFCTILLTAYMTCLFCNCSSYEKSSTSSAVIMSWNVQTFFDALEEGSEFAEFRGGKTRWNAGQYEARLDRLMEVIESIGRGKGLPDMLLLQEIENAGVLYDLSNRNSFRIRGKPAFRYGIYAGEKGGAFGVGALSRFPIIRAAVHRVTTGDAAEAFTRPVLEVEAALPGNAGSLILFICHWKSKHGNSASGNALRALQESALGTRMLLASQRYPGVTAIAAGDFNRPREEFTLQRDGSPEEMPYIQLDTLSGEPYSVSGFPIAEYDEYGGQSTGTYYFRGKWETIDHFLISPGHALPRAFILNNGPHITPEGTPFRYEVFSGRGYSDHVPIMLDLPIDRRVPSIGN